MEIFDLQRLPRLFLLRTNSVSYFVTSFAIKRQFDKKSGVMIFKFPKTKVFQWMHRFKVRKLKFLSQQCSRYDLLYFFKVNRAKENNICSAWNKQQDEGNEAKRLKRQTAGRQPGSFKLRPEKTQANYRRKVCLLGMRI